MSEEKVAILKKGYLTGRKRGSEVCGRHGIALNMFARYQETFPGISPRIISDNGPQFMVRDFGEFIRVRG